MVAAVCWCLSPLGVRFTFEEYQEWLIPVSRTMYQWHVAGRQDSQESYFKQQEQEHDNPLSSGAPSPDHKTSDWHTKAAEATKGGYQTARTGASTTRVMGPQVPRSSSPDGLALTAKGNGGPRVPATTLPRTPSKPLVPPIIGLGKKIRSNDVSRSPRQIVPLPGAAPLHCLTALLAH